MRQTKLERDYQAELVKRLEKLFPGCFIMVNDARRIQGVPDLIILWHNMWAMLEVKASAAADVQPNQPYYVGLLDGMSFAAFIYPENEEEVLNDLRQAFGVRRKTRLSLAV